MRPAGRAEIGRARADGRWEATQENQATSAAPEDVERSPRKAGKSQGVPRRVEQRDGAAQRVSTREKTLI